MIDKIGSSLVAEFARNIGKTIGNVSGLTDMSDDDFNRLLAKSAPDNFLGDSADGLYPTLDVARWMREVLIDLAAELQKCDE